MLQCLRRHASLGLPDLLRRNRGGGHRGLARHIRYTQSPVAARLLVEWERSQPKFVKVIPQDFKRVMAAIKKAQETGVSADEAVMASAHG